MKQHITETKQGLDKATYIDIQKRYSKLVRDTDKTRVYGSNLRRDEFTPVVKGIGFNGQKEG